MGYEINENAASTPIFTEEKERIQQLSRDTGETTADAIREPNISFFIDNRPQTEDPVKLAEDLGLDIYPTYTNILSEIIINGKTTLDREELRILFYYTAEIKHKSSNKFRRYLSHKGLQLKQVWIKDKNVVGIAFIPWEITDDIKKQWIQDLREKGGTKLEAI